MTHEQSCPSSGSWSRKRLIITLIASIGGSLTVLLATLILILTLANRETPLEKTLSAVLPDLSILSAEQGELRINGELGKDVLYDEGDAPENFQPLPFDIVAAQNKKGEVYFSGSLGYEDNPVAATLTGGEGYLYLASPLMGDQVLGLTAENAQDMETKLKQSLFAPDSGSRYALSQEDFDSLLEMLTVEDEDMSVIDQVRLQKATVKPECG